MLTKYIQAAMRQAEYEIIEDDGTYYGRIPGLQGVWANESILEDCREELQSALEDWLLLSLVNNFPVPVVDGIELSVERVA